MENVEKVRDDLYIVKQEMRPGWFCSIVVLFGAEKIGIIDTGFENTPGDFARARIEMETISGETWFLRRKPVHRSPSMNLRLKL